MNRIDRPNWLLRKINLPHLAAEIAIVAAAGLGAFLLRFEFELPRAYLPHLAVSLAVWVAVKVVVFRLFQMDKRAWRFFSITDVLQLTGANLTASAISAPILWLSLDGYPRSVPILDLMLSMFFFGARFLAGRFATETYLRRHGAGARNTFIYGAGRAGAALLGELRHKPALGYRVRGFIDDDPAHKGMIVQGTKVLGCGADLTSLAPRLGVEEVLIATPSADGEQMLAILRHCQRARIRYRTVPALAEIVEGAGIASQIREVDVQDLLSRQPAELDHRLLREKIAGRVVMVTGAAGSIGSELCRQIAKYRPAALVAFEIAETPLFHLAREMHASFPELRFHGEIGSVQNESRIRSVLATYGPSLIFHAAAYKHVTIMETSVIEAVSNNVIGTRTVARSAVDYGVEAFVLISSDKAVRPTSVMGATKRLCERLILDMPAGRTRFMAVRFGNVLGSNGSVVPLFKQQIAQGGPVTVTDPEMRRYFMTIPEASQLVLQASAMGLGGEVFVLDMGEQVRIVDIARKLILLSGLSPDCDIRIEFTGMRPGEKLYEELNLDDEMTLPTSHRKIKIFAGVNSEAGSMERQVERLDALCQEARTGDLIELIRDLVPEYQPSNLVLSMAANREGAAARIPLREPVGARADRRR